MRLTCPNCGAQYEVPGDAIPQAGRDVQCSNCGDTWFQTHPDHPAARQGGAAAPDDRQQAAPEPAAKPAVADAPEQPTQDPEDTTTTSPEADKPGSEARPVRREIDPAVASVLREEAEREKRARAAARGGGLAGGLEVQTDLGLQDAPNDDRHSVEARARMASLRGDDGAASDPQGRIPKDIHERQTDPQKVDAQDGDTQGIDPVSRRSLFPDLAEINSSLAPGGDANRSDSGNNAYPEARPGTGGGFRRGFLSALLIAVAALLVYVFAPQLSDALPALRNTLSDYVVWIDGLRLWLDSQIAALMLWLDGMASTANAPAGDTAPE